MIVSSDQGNLHPNRIGESLFKAAGARKALAYINIAAPVVSPILARRRGRLYGCCGFSR